MKLSQYGRSGRFFHPSKGLKLTKVVFCWISIVALNTLSSHALCTVAFMAFPHIMCWILCMPRKLDFAAHFSYICTVSIVAAVLIVMIALGVEDQKSLPGMDVHITLVGKPIIPNIGNSRG